MKINRFNSINENNSTFGEKWTKEKFDKIEKLKSEIINEEDNLRHLLKKYLLLNPQLQEIVRDLDENELEIVKFDYTPNRTIVFTIWYRAEYDDFEDFDANMNQKNFNDFLEFLKDPDIYINTKKYNL